MLTAAGYTKTPFISALADDGTFTPGTPATDGTNLEKKGENNEGILNVVLGTSLTAIPESYTLTGKFTVDAMEFPVSAEIAVAAPVATMVASSAMSKEDKMTYAATIGSLSYPENNIALDGTYYLTGTDKTNAKIVYTISQNQEGLSGTPASISGTDLTWNKWNSLDLKIKAQMVLLDNENIALGAPVEYTASIADPIKGEIKNTSAANKVLYYNTDAQTLDLATIVTLKTIKEDEVFAANGLNSTVSDAIGGDVEFVVTGYNEEEEVISVAGSTITVTNTVPVYSNTTTLNVTVKYSNQFKAYKDFSFDVLVKPASEKK